MVAHPTEPSWLISSSHGNNEVSIWNIETGHREGALWASSAPPLTKETSNVSLRALANHIFSLKITLCPQQTVAPATVCGLIAGTIDRSPFILTGSSDQRIRYWDLAAMQRTRGHSSTAESPRGRRYLTAPKNCGLIIPGARDNINEMTAYTYEYDDDEFVLSFCLIDKFLFNS